MNAQLMWDRIQSLLHTTVRFCCQFDSEKFHLRNGNGNLFFMEQQIFHYSKLEFDSENKIAI